MSVKCQDEYGDYNERIVLSQRYWKSDAVQTNKKCLFVCLEMSIKCQDEYGHENERIVLSQRNWKSNAE